MITVALPLYKAASIGWLALEGLCRQECRYPWELIVLEEMDPDPIPNFQDYTDRLKAAGCKTVTHIPLDKWMPLAQKWRTMARIAHKDSRTFILQAADCYSDPDRINRSHEAILSGHDWTHSTKGVFWDLTNDHRAVYVHPPNAQTALNMAVRTDLIRDLPSEDRRSGIDGWMYKCAQDAKGEPLKVHEDTSDAWGGALDTHGFNNISHKRGKLIAERGKMFYACEVELKELLPLDVAERLQTMIDG